MGALQTIGRRIVEAVEDRTGREIVPRDQLALLESAEGERRVLRKTLDFIGFSLMNYQGQPQIGRMPTDMAPIARVAAAAMCQRAWTEDPMAGQMVDLYVSFVLGRGVPRPRAHDNEVQEILDRCWDDPANMRILTGYGPLVEKAIDLAIQSTVFFKVFDDGQDGMVRVSLVPFDDILEAVRHPADQYRIVYYRGIERQVKYDYATGAYRSLPGDAGKPKTVYYEAAGGFDDDDPVMIGQDNLVGGRAAFAPPAGMMRPGKLMPLAVNKTSEMAFGVPRMRRLLRWWTAYNEVLESHVNRMKAMASVYMKFTAKGANGRQLEQLGRMASGRRSSAFGESQEFGEGPRHGGQPGVLGGNEALDFEPFKIDSGASDVAASIPQLRAQVSGIFPPTYYGEDAGGLAGGQTVELPVLKFVERDQEAWNAIFHGFGDAAIKAAIKAGDLEEWRKATQAEIDEVEASEQTGQPVRIEINADGKVERDLKFDVSLPSPLKRAMGDLVTAAVTTATAIDPMGSNPELSRWLFAFILAEAFDDPDPMRTVDEVLPRHAALAAAQDIDPATGLPREPPADGSDTTTGADDQQHPPGNQYGAKVNSPQPEDRKVSEAQTEGMLLARLPPGRRRVAVAAANARHVSLAEMFADQVGGAGVVHAAALGRIPTRSAA